MTLRPCLACGRPTDATRCADHQVDTKASARTRGYNAAWDNLSRRARRLQPFCGHCGATTDLQCDHTPQAWERHDAGLVIRLEDVAVLCGACNRAAGQARGEGAQRTAQGPVGKAECGSLSKGTG